MSSRIPPLRALIDKRRYEDALSLCAQLLEADPNSKVDVLRSRADIFMRVGDYRAALRDRLDVLELGDRNIRDLYRAADASVWAEQFDEAVNCLNSVLVAGSREGDKWFRGASLFLLAYAQMELGRFEEAVDSLDLAEAAEPSVAMPIRGAQLRDTQWLRREIAKRRGRKP